MGGQVTPDLTNGLFSQFGQFGFGNAGGNCPPATQFFVALIVVPNSFAGGPFFLHLYQ